MFIINASDLKPLYSDNYLDKYADDTYLIIPSGNDDTVADELQSIEKWADNNNLKLNHQKSAEMVIYSNETSRSKGACAPILPNILRVNSLKILGVTLDHTLSISEHVSNICQSAAQNMYAVKLLKSHGLNQQSIFSVCRATVVSRLTYACPAWWGFTSAADRQKFQTVVNRAVRWGFYRNNDPSIEEIVNKIEDKLFSSILTNPSHVLFQFLPNEKILPYTLRNRGHKRILPSKDNRIINKNFLNRLLYKSM